MLDGECIEASAPPSTMLLDWLRAQRRVGTKEGCAEGDCGACTVVLGRRDAGGALQVEPCNACIRPLASVDGCGVLTVEGLHGAHPVQQAMIECHASQCGFCTPGFVMALVARLAQCERTGPLASRAQVEQALAGNLCRCTGYRPIVDAALRAGERLAQRGEPALPDWLLELPPLAGEPPLGFEAGGARFDAPRSAEDVDRLLAASPQAWLLAGDAKRNQ